MKKIALVAAVLAICATTAVVEAQETVSVPVGCTVSLPAATAPVGVPVQVWAQGEVTVHEFVVDLDPGTYTLVIEKHPSVAAVVMLGRMEVSPGDVIRVSQPTRLYLRAGAELRWDDVPGTCYGYQMEIVPVARATTRRLAGVDLTTSRPAAERSVREK